MLRARLATAAAAIPLLLALIFLGPAWGLGVLVAAVATLALVEYMRLAFPAQPRDRAIGLGLGALVIAAAATSAGSAASSSR